jgi:hypothetical protein
VTYHEQGNKVTYCVSGGTANGEGALDLSRGVHWQMKLPAAGGAQGTKIRIQLLCKVYGLYQRPLRNWLNGLLRWILTHFCVARSLKNLNTFIRSMSQGLMMVLPMRNGINKRSHRWHHG